MTETQKLLADYAKTGSETAFRELAGRYVDLVYSAAVRLVDGDTHLAEDVTQTVFVDLARKAGALSSKVMLGGWLHRHTCYAASMTMRSERRRQNRERQAVEMNEGNPESSFAEAAPLLDETINELNEEDRAAIVLRFFEQRDLRAVGEALGSSEDAAQKRVARALGKLRGLLARRGITFSGAASISSAALAGTAAAGGTTLTVLKLMNMTKLQLGVTALVIAGAATTLMIQHRAQTSLREENQSLRQQNEQLQTDNENLSKRAAQIKRGPTPRLPAPAMRTTAPTTAAAEDLPATNLYARLKDKQPKLTAEQAEPYLEANRRSAASLLAAYRTTGEPALLEEAMRKYPNEPQVAFETALKNDATPEERRQWVDALKKSAPDNALGNYLSALDYFKAGQNDQAVQELTAASGKPFQDYTAERYQDDSEAYLAAGYSVADAKTVSSMQLLLPQLKQVKELGLDMIDLAKSYRQAGDDASAQAALQMAIGLGQRYSNPSPGEAEISQLVGMSLERIALNAMDPNSVYGSNDQTVQERINQITQHKAELEELNRQLEPLLQEMPDQDWIGYKDRWLMFGEENAVRWVINKHGQK